MLQGHDHSYGRGNVGTASPVEGTTVYVVSVSGPKMYGQDASNWNDNGAVQKKALRDTQLYQLIDVSDGVLRYEARTGDGEALRPVRDPQGRGRSQAIVEVESEEADAHDAAHASGAEHSH